MLRDLGEFIYLSYESKYYISFLSALAVRLCLLVLMKWRTVLYRGCPGRNVPDFGKMFLNLLALEFGI